MSALFSFLGGSVFRMLWGEISSAWTSHQEHKHEIERLKVQGDIDAAAHARNLEAIRVQADMGIKVLEAQTSSQVEILDVGTFGRVVDMTGAKSGYAIVDVWNGIIRPLLATEAIILISLHVYRNDWTLDEYSMNLIAAVLGIYLADRSLMKRGK